MRNRSVDIPQRTPLRFLHDKFDGFIKAFKIPLHGAEHFCLGRHRVPLGNQALHFVSQFIPTLDTGGLAKSVAGDGIIGSGHILTGAAQVSSGSIQEGFGILLALVAAGKVIFQFFHADSGLLHAIFQAADIRFPACNIGSQIGFLGTQFQELLLSSLGIGGHNRQLLLQLQKGGLLLRKHCLDLGNALLGLLDLLVNAAAAVILAAEFFLDAGNVTDIIIHTGMQHCQLAFQLLVHRLQGANLFAGRF